MSVSAANKYVTKTTHTALTASQNSNGSFTYQYGDSLITVAGNGNGEASGQAYVDKDGNFFLDGGDNVEIKGGANNVKYNLYNAKNIKSIDTGAGEDEVNIGGESTFGDSFEAKGLDEDGVWLSTATKNQAGDKFKSAKNSSNGAGDQFAANMDYIKNTHGEEIKPNDGSYVKPDQGDTVDQYLSKNYHDWDQMTEAQQNAIRDGFYAINGETRTKGIYYNSPYKLPTFQKDKDGNITGARYADEENGSRTCSYDSNNAAKWTAKNGVQAGVGSDGAAAQATGSGSDVNGNGNGVDNGGGGDKTVQDNGGGGDKTVQDNGGGNGDNKGGVKGNGNGNGTTTTFLDNEYKKYGQGTGWATSERAEDGSFKAWKDNEMIEYSGDGSYIKHKYETCYHNGQPAPKHSRRELYNSSGIMTRYETYKEDSDGRHMYVHDCDKNGKELNTYARYTIKNGNYTKDRNYTKYQGKANGQSGYYTVCRDVENGHVIDTWFGNKNNYDNWFNYRTSNVANAMNNKGSKKERTKALNDLETILSDPNIPKEVRQAFMDNIAYRMCKEDKNDYNNEAVYNWQTAVNTINKAKEGTAFNKKGDDTADRIIGLCNGLFK